MKLSAAETRRFCEAPRRGVAGALLYGEDLSLVQAMGDVLGAALRAAARSDDTLTIERMDGAAVRRAPADLHSALRSSGFFATRTLVFIDGATDGTTPAVEAALDGLTPEDGFLCALAGSLPARSKLRTLFEQSNNAIAGALYRQPLSADELGTRLADAGLKRDAIEDDALRRATDLLAEQPYGVVAQSVEKIVVYALDKTAAINADEISTLIEPADVRDLEHLIASVGHRDASAAATLVRKATGRGTSPVQICLALLRHLRRLHELTLAGDLERALGALRPPVFGPRRDDLKRQVSLWTTRRVETGLTDLSRLDAQLRNAGNRPDIAIVERVVVRLALG